MAFDIGDRVKVADGHSQWRGHMGTITDTVTLDDNISPHTVQYEVRLDGFGCHQTVPLLEAQLRTTTLESPVEYEACS